MLPETLLNVIALALELTIRIHDDIPLEQRELFWARHQQRVIYIEELMSRVLVMLKDQHGTTDSTQTVVPPTA